MKILFIDSAHPLLHSELTRMGHQCDLNYDRTPEQVIQDLKHFDGAIIRSKIKFTKEVIDQAGDLKFIARVGAGMENIDVQYAESKGIKCLHAPEGNRDAVAEHAIAMILALFNNLCKADKEVREGKWIREGNRGYELMGKTVGIIGYGYMGSAFAERLKSFSCNILVYDKYKKGFGNDVVHEVSLDKLFEETDILSLHVSYSKETHYLVNDQFINNFKKPIYIINTARGKNIHTADLVKNMQTGKVLGACLDVIEYEAVSFEQLDSPDANPHLQYLTKSEKTVLSPHIGGWTHESNEKMARILVNKIIQNFPS